MNPESVIRQPALFCVITQIERLPVGGKECVSHFRGAGYWTELRLDVRRSVFEFQLCYLLPVRRSFFEFQLFLSAK